MLSNHICASGRHVLTVASGERAVCKPSSVSESIDGEFGVFLDAAPAEGGWLLPVVEVSKTGDEWHAMLAPALPKIKAAGKYYFAIDVVGCKRVRVGVEGSGSCVVELGKRIAGGVI